MVAWMQPWPHTHACIHKIIDKLLAEKYDMGNADNTNGRNRVAKGTKECPHCGVTIKGCRTIHCPECGLNTIEEKEKDKKYKYYLPPGIYPPETKYPIQIVHAPAGKPLHELKNWDESDEQLIEWALDLRQSTLSQQKIYLNNNALEYFARNFCNVSYDQAKRSLRYLPDVKKVEIIEDGEVTLSG